MSPPALWTVTRFFSIMAIRIGVAMIRLIILILGPMIVDHGRGIRASPAERKKNSGIVTACSLVSGGEVMIEWL